MMTRKSGAATMTKKAEGSSSSSSPPQERSAIPTVDGHPAVTAAREKLGEAEQAMRDAEQRLTEAERIHDNAKASLVEARGLWALKELDDAGLDAAASHYEQALKDLEAAQQDLQGRLRAVEVLRERLAAAEQQARMEVEESLNDLRRDLVEEIAERLVALVPLNHRLLLVEEALRQQGFVVAAGPLALPELVATVEGNALRSEAVAFLHHPADELLARWLARLRAAGIDAPEPPAVPLRDLVARGE